MARVDKHRTPPAIKMSKDWMSIVLMVAIVFGLLGVVGIDEIAGKIFFGVIGIAALLLFIRRTSKKRIERYKTNHQADHVSQVSSTPVTPYNPQNPMNTHTNMQPKESRPCKPELPTTSCGFPMKYSYEPQIAFAPGQIPDFRLIALGDDLVFTPEPENTYDPNAIVISNKHQKLGYVFQGNMQEMIHDYQKRGDSVIGKVSDIDFNALKIKYLIGFYKEKRRWRPAPYDTALLTGNTSEEIQDNISMMNIGDVVTVDYDYEKERYEVHDGGWSIIGYLPKKLEKYADEEVEFVIDEIGTKDNDKYFVCIAVYPVSS